MSDLKYWAVATVIVFAFLFIISLADEAITSHSEDINIIKRFLTDFNIENDELSAYPQYYQCDNKQEIDEKCEWINLPYITYKVNYDTQSVIYWSSDKILYKAENCIVRDRKNWQCSNDFRFGFIDGEFVKTDSENYRYVPRTDYWLHYLDNKHSMLTKSIKKVVKKATINGHDWVLYEDGTEEMVKGKNPN